MFPFFNEQRSTDFKQRVSESGKVLKEKICKNHLSVHILDHTDSGTAVLTWILSEIHLECLYRRAVNYMVFLNINQNLSIHSGLKLIHQRI